MAEYCPRARCAWTNGIYSKCTWPGGQCPYQHERDKAPAAEQAKKEAVEASRQARKREHICALEAYHNGKLTGIYQKDGKWQVYIHYNGERRYIGTYRALDLAIDAHTQALRHKVEGDFEEWLAKRKKGAKNDIS